jgi:excinuclease ABC subunit A
MSIRIKGAREHNLQTIDVEFSDGLTVVTGISGSGKTSLVFDTLYHEARRRFLDAFALGSHQRLSPAAVDSIVGLGPAVAIGQNLLNRNPNSNLASASGLHPFLRLLYTHYGYRSCARCGTSLSVLSEDEIVDLLTTLSKKGPVTVFAPLVHRAHGSHTTLLRFLTEVFEPDTLIIDGAPIKTSKSGKLIKLASDDPHEINVRLGRWTRPIPISEARQAIHTAGALGSLALITEINGDRVTLSRIPACIECGHWFSDLRPSHFNSFCLYCHGEGCEICAGTGMHSEAAATRWHGFRFPDLLSHSVAEVRSLFQTSELPSTANRLRNEIELRLEALDEVGLGYVSLDRPSPSLSRGEAQRVRLAVALTARLEDMVHVLDEPTIGQHPSDMIRLLPSFRKLAGPVIYVEHDRLAAAAADHAIDLGPGAGSEGGRLVYAGTPIGLWKTNTPTGYYFSLRERVHTPKPRPKPEAFLTIRGADLRNLQDIDVSLPLNRLTVITGVSGSGKSTLVEDVLVTSLAENSPHGCREIGGPPLKPILVDQSPIGRNPRSNPATYTKLSDVVRDLFAEATGLSSSHFSFNRPEGACPSCKGMGAIEVKMRYLPSTWIRCESCGGRRFSDEILEAQVEFGPHALSIADFYNLSVSEALLLLADSTSLSPKALGTALKILETLRDVGLGYITLGQPSPTLSGGEAQRVKLAKFLGRKSLSTRLLALDEPSTGLHPHDINALLVALDRLVKAGATIVIIEHNTDVIRAADWVIDLGPGAGPEGGRVLYDGSIPGLLKHKTSLTGQALRDDTSTPSKEKSVPSTTRSASISVRGARVHNLKNVNLDFPKGAFTVVTGVSGSGKSSLVRDLLGVEARRRFLETLSLYERQSYREGSEVEVGSVTGLGVTLAVEPRRRRYEFRATVGTATEISHHLSAVLALSGKRSCLKCSEDMHRERKDAREILLCPSCDAVEPVAQPRHFSPTTYSAACTHCQGIGSLQIPNPDKLIVHPEKPLCDGAMHSPGFFPKGYLCKPFNHGYDMVQALGARYSFDPATTPWNKMSSGAQQAFLFGDPEPMEVEFRSRTRSGVKTITFPGFYGFLRDWDVGGTYTDRKPCPECSGARFRPAILAVTLGGYNIYKLSEMSLSTLNHTLDNLALPDRDSSSFNTNNELIENSLEKIKHRLRFLLQVGLGYLHLNRLSNTLSAGEAQRIQLAGLLGSGLTSLTVLLDEPSRGLHPSEVEALVDALVELRGEGNTVIVVEHDPVLIRAADHLIDLGPGAGEAGGEIVAQGTLTEVLTTETLTTQWMRGERRFEIEGKRRQPAGWMTIRGARAHNLKENEINIPLGVLVGVCGVSGSGKSTLIVDTIGRALAPVKHTTSVAFEPIEPGEHDRIDGAPTRTILVDQSRAGVTSPAAFLKLDRPLRKLYAKSETAQALGLTEKMLARNCTTCRGRGVIRIDMGFLPPVFSPCDTCRGTGYPAEAFEIRLKDLALSEIDAFTLDRVYELFGEEAGLATPLTTARDVGLGYLVFRQPGRALSGGEVQRLKIASELCKRTRNSALYLLDEPTVGQHLEDVARLTKVLHRLVEEGHTVLVVEHHPHLLASCDWLIELGPGGGPEGGRVIATGTPEEIALGNTPTAPFLQEIIGALDA